ncbi:MAG: hypothetical protein KA035_02320 [Candidatus Levybacteria bacterium]|nr:hypothetical protein [Candidatus Levybacteria bacterium]
MAAVFLAACSEDKIPDDVSLNQPVRDVLNNDLAGGKLVQTFNLGSECFDLRVEYSTEYTTVGWRITDSKTLYMRAEMSNMDPNCNPEVLVEHMHADVSIKSRKEGIDGLKQDSMDDSIHGGLQPGFSIVPPYHYENVFAIEGFSQTLISGWSFYYSGYGGGGINEKRLTEKSLVDDGGACASKFQIVFDLLIRNPGEEAYHTRSVVSEFFVPVPGGNCAALQIAEEKATPD